MSGKRDYLELVETIKAFRAKYPQRGSVDGAVHKLLHHHLYRSTEMLLAEVNGGLDGEYEEEAKQMEFGL